MLSCSRHAVLTAPGNNLIVLYIRPPETLKTDFVFPQQAQPFQNPGTNAQRRPLGREPTETFNIEIRFLEQEQSFQNVVTIAHSQL